MSTLVSNPARTATAVRTPSVRREQLWLPVAIVLAALIGLAGWMLLVSPVRQETASITAQTDTVSRQADALRTQIATLKTQQADLPRYRAQLAAAQAALPVDTGMPALLRTLQQLGTATGTSVTALTADNPTVVGPDGTPTTGGSATPTPGTVYAMPVDITAKGTAAALTTFLGQLQSAAPRALLVTDVHLADGGDGEQLDVTATAFLQPTTAGGR